MTDTVKNYLCVCRKSGEATPQKITLSATTVMNSIEKMCKAAGVTDSNGFDAFDIMEITEDGNAYIPVYQKLDSIVKGERLSRCASRNLAAITGVPATDMVVATPSTEEAAYSTVEVEDV